MKPVPIVFNLGPLQIHTYGVGLAITFFFALTYLQRRLRKYDYEFLWMNQAFIWIIGAALLGARIVHLGANATFYFHHPIEIPQVWHGGLSSFGGLAGGIPAGLYLAKRHVPELTALKALDIAAPMLMAAWGVGRLLGPQFEINGGGRQTTAWYGLQYAGQVGKRLPAPLFQSVESFVVFGILIFLERHMRNRPDGILIAGLALFWGMARFADESLWLAIPRFWDAVEVTALVLITVGGAAMAALLWKARKRGQAAYFSRVPLTHVAVGSDMKEVVGVG
jgi:phosphatidylglycerol:prolipoprotein diacylglycerol transferase